MARENRLARETSPYLLQHARNPVDWYPWGDEALERARSENRPILLSIGYAACHWCHVMERESFEDAETARLMNESFVNVKVDREERPDLDSIYMGAVQAMTGHGGWPMTVFLTPDGKPFYGGTYFPPEDRHGLPAFSRVLGAVTDAWRHRREEIETQSSTLVDHIGRAALVGASTEPLQASTLTEAARAMAGAADPEWGGFGTPKFPQAPTLEFLLRMHGRGATEALPPLALTLRRMARGGVFDHVGGGFHRYAVDHAWQVPHFEKMLYDNGQLLRLYARAWLATRDPLHRDAAIRTGEYLLRDLRHPEGGFFSSQDADSEGEEGRFYVWTLEEIHRVTGDDAEAVARAFDVRAEGNWEGTNVLWMPREDDAVAAELGASVEELRGAIARALPRLFEARAARVPPATDDKVLAGWNGLAISGLAEAGRALDRPDFVEAARAAAEFVLAALRRPDGRLLRAWRDGRAGVPAFLDDHAMLSCALLDLYETTFESRWFEEAERLARETIRLFGDEERGGFFDTGADAGGLVLRPKTVFDNATPCGNSVAAETLLRIAALTGDADLERAGAGPLRLAHELMPRAPLAFGFALCALDLYLNRPAEVAVIGDPGAAETQVLVRVAWEAWDANRVLAAGPAGSESPPLLRGRTAADGRAAAYVCRSFVCERPVTDAAALAESLGGARSG